MTENRSTFAIISYDKDSMSCFFLRKKHKQTNTSGQSTWQCSQKL